MNVVDRVAEHIRTLVPYAPGKPIEEVEREFGITNSWCKRRERFERTSRCVSLPMIFKGWLRRLHLERGWCFWPIQITRRARSIGGPSGTDFSRKYLIKF